MLKYIIAIGTVAALASGIETKPEAAPTAVAAPVVAKCSSTFGIMELRRVVRLKLVRPNTASFPWVPNREVSLGNCTFRVYSMVEAKNRLGMTVWTPWTGVVRRDQSGQTWTVQSLKFN